MVKTALFNRRQPGGVYTIQEITEHPGDIFFVNSENADASDTAGFGQNPDKPTATLDYAVGLCAANNGDVIYCMPGHAEDLGAASAVDVDLAGIKIVGLGDGADRPTFTATAIAGDFKLAAASGYIENLLFLSGVDATTGMLEISGADCTVFNCEFRDSVDEATDCLITVDGADRLLIDSCAFNMDAGAGANSAIALDGSDDAVIRDTYIHGNFAVGAIDCRTTLSARVNFHDLKIWTTNAADIAIVDTITASTGFVGPNLQLMLAQNAANITESCTGATFQYYAPILVVNLAGEQGMAIDITTSTDA